MMCHIQKILTFSLFAIKIKLKKFVEIRYYLKQHIFNRKFERKKVFKKDRNIQSLIACERMNNEKCYVHVCFMYIYE